MPGRSSVLAPLVDLTILTPQGTVDTSIPSGFDQETEWEHAISIPP